MKTVLIVEDTADYAENLKYILLQAGYGVEVAMMDILMPEQDGVEKRSRSKNRNL